MRRLTEQEKKQLGLLIKYYRQALYRSRSQDRREYTQKNFAKGICSQAQLSRIENGEVIRDHEIYGALLKKLNLSHERLKGRDTFLFDEFVHNLLFDLNRSDRVIDYERAYRQLEYFQGLFADNIIYLHYTYALELVLLVLHEDYDEAGALYDLVEGTLDILPNPLLILTLQYLGRFHSQNKNFKKAQIHLELALEHMLSERVDNPSVFLDLAQNAIWLNEDRKASAYLAEAGEHFKQDPLLRALIDYYYSIIYAKAGEYDESIGKIYMALEHLQHYPYPVPQRKNKLIIALVIMHLLNGDRLGARDVLITVPKEHQTDDHHFLFAYIARDFTLFPLIQRHYNKLADFYMAKEKDRVFELDIASRLYDYPYPLILLILKDYYWYLKARKKYKKALDLIERYRLLLNIFVSS